MCLRNTNETYGVVAKFLHWLIAILVVIMLCAGVSFNYLPNGNFMNTLIFIHKSTGVTILGLMVLRLLWSTMNPVPAFPLTMPRWEKIAARFTHSIFFVLIIAMPITGIFMSLAAGYTVPFWGITTVHLTFVPKNKALAAFMANWHTYLAWTIAAFIALHTLAALKHHYKDKDSILKRMWFK
jgi:cytochrome b561